MATAAYVITKAMRLFGILDAVEQPTAADLANNVIVLNDLLRNEQADGASQYLVKLVTVQLPPGVNQQIYTFSIGTAQSSYLVQQDAVIMRALWMNDINLTVNRETRPGPKADVVRTTYPGIITKWHQETQVDGSILVTAWQPPRAAAQALIEIGGRVPALTNPAGTDTVALPPEGLHDAALLLGRLIYKSYGVAVLSTDTIVKESEAANRRWRDYARGQQWLRFVRS